MKTINEINRTPDTIEIDVLRAKMELSAYLPAIFSDYPSKMDIAYKWMKEDVSFEDIESRLWVLEEEAKSYTLDLEYRTKEALDAELEQEYKTKVMAREHPDSVREEAVIYPK